MSSDYDITRKRTPEAAEQKEPVNPAASKKTRITNTAKKALKSSESTESFHTPKPPLKGQVGRKQPTVQEAYTWLKGITPTSTNVPKRIKQMRALVEQQGASPLDKIGEILDRFDQLEKVDIDTKRLTCAERLQLAVYIEETVPRVVSAAKKTFVEIGETVPRELIIKKKGSVVLISKTPNWERGGTYKKVSAAVLVPLDRAAKLSKIVHALIDITEPSEISMNKQEIAFFKMVKGQPGFVQMHTFFEIGKTEISQIRAAYEAYDGTLTDLIQQPLSTSQKLYIAKQFLEAMVFFHDNNAYHLDLKMDNVLASIDTSGKVKIGVADFGLSIKKEPNEAYDLSMHLLSDGRYGTEFASAPELIGNIHITDEGDTIEKIDAWAVGMLLHELFYGDPSWSQMLNESDGTLTGEMKDQVTDLVNKDIETPLLKLLQKKRPNQKDKIKIAIFQLLRLDPKDRFTVRQALQAINQAQTLSR